MSDSLVEICIKDPREAVKGPFVPKTSTPSARAISDLTFGQVTGGVLTKTTATALDKTKDIVVYGRIDGPDSINVVTGKLAFTSTTTPPYPSGVAQAVPLNEPNGAGGILFHFKLVFQVMVVSGAWPASSPLTVIVYYGPTGDVTSATVSGGTV
jgi:hypothetical protein